MPSPFPGMDPYLEGTLWSTLHFSLGAEIVRQLAPKLRPRYLALPVERFVLDIEDSVSVTTAPVYPDVAVTGREPADPAGPTPTTATLAAPMRATTVMATPVPHVTIEIRDVQERRLVTAVEILSPTNKQGEGCQEYLAKRQRLLLSTAHLLEIDLLRRGRRPPMHQALPKKASYFVFLSRVESRPLTDVWPIGLAEPLPTVPVPLLAGDPDVPLDLQAALSESYDVLGYDLAVDYRRDPEFPLPKGQRRWLGDVLAAAGRRP